VFFKKLREVFVGKKIIRWTVGVIALLALLAFVKGFIAGLKESANNAPTTSVQ